MSLSQYGLYFKDEWGGVGKYTGEGVCGVPHGQGVVKYICGGATYVGAFENGKTHGQGIYTDTHQKYVGAYKNGKRNGKGTQTLADGSVRHSGLWKDGMPVR